MLDEHIANKSLGLLPYIRVFGISIPSYAVFMVLAFATGFLCYKLTAEKLDKEKSSVRALIIIFALLGGIVGAKLPIILYHYDLIFRYPQNLDLLYSGRTIVGGLIGGFAAVFFLKRYLKLKIRTGNDIAAPAALGMAVGRVGCLLGGCCYGIPSPAFLGINLGDGIPRYPTQIYEIVFDLGLFGYFLYLKKNRDLEPGILFRYLVNAYFLFRFFIEFIRETEKFAIGISYYQILCVFCLVFINRNWIKSRIRNRTTKKVRKEQDYGRK